MKQHSRKSLARAAVTMLGKHTLGEVSSALAQEIVRERSGRTVNVFMFEVADEMYKKHAHLHAEITSARVLSAPMKKVLENFLQKTCNADVVDAVYNVDEGLIGGIKIVTPIGMMDISIARKLNQLTQHML